MYLIKKGRMSLSQREEMHVFDKELKTAGARPTQFMSIVMFQRREKKR